MIKNLREKRRVLRGQGVRQLQWPTAGLKNGAMPLAETCLDHRTWVILVVVLQINSNLQQCA